MVLKFLTLNLVKQKTVEMNCWRNMTFVEDFDTEMCIVCKL